MRKLLIALSVLLGAAAAAAWLGIWFFTPGSPADATFTVNPGDSVDAVAAGLRDKGIIRSTAAFKVFLRLKGVDAKIQPGTYDFTRVADFDTIARRLASGGLAADEFVLLIKEGWGIRDIVAELKRQGYADTDGFLSITGQPASVGVGSNMAEAGISVDDYPFLKDKPSSLSLEGFLFPDTYRIRRDSQPADIVRRLLDNFGRKLRGDLQKKIDGSGHSIFEVVTMASVIEREVRTPEDRRQVADIFWRRLESGMPLQSCATVNYVTGKSSPAVSLEDTKINSPYNTYRYPGLPIGPIGNPGLDSLLASVEPKANPYWYFLTDNDGNVHYATTLSDHNDNKARYLK